MKTIGLIGGMSWESTAVYYRLINQATRQSLGGLHSARIALLSVDFATIAQHQAAGDWHTLGELMADAGATLERAGADCVLICTNTMHKLSPEIEAATRLPLIHIADVTAQAALKQGVKRVGLLGTRFTMEQAFYRERLEAHGLEVIVPETSDRDTTHRIIFDELCQGRVETKSRAEYLRIMDTLKANGAQGVVLGCTEIPLLIGREHTDLPLFDTTALHAQAAVDFALS